MSDRRADLAKIAALGQEQAMAEVRMRQDAIDGAALRRLMDVVGGGAFDSVEVERDDAGERPWWVGCGHRFEARGSTFAEAADKCREALG